MIYLDHAATTQALKIATETMVKYSDEEFYNPSAGYASALAVKRALSDATEKFAELLGARKEEIIFTSCATESNNTAFECGVKNKKGNVVVSAVEHASVYECAMRLRSRGVDVRFVNPNTDGVITEEALTSIMDENTSFVSIMHASNETGVINDLKKLSSIAKSISPKVVFHSDGVQAFCKINTNVDELGVDLYSVSAHKVGGLKGVGALYVRKGLNIPAYIVGGGQQSGRRSGTENVGGIIGFCEASQEYRNLSKSFDAQKLRNIVIDRFLSYDWIKINGGNNNTGYVISLSFKGLRGEILAHMVEENGVLVGLGSACSTHVKTNRVLSAMGVPKSYSDGSIRLSFSPKTSVEEVERATEIILQSAVLLKEKING